MLRGAAAAVASACARRAASSSASFTAAIPHRFCGLGLFGLQCRTKATSVFDAQRKIFGFHPSEGRNSTKFNHLKQLRSRGFIGPQLEAYYPEMPALAKHPIYRDAQNDHIRAKVEARKAVGKGPPKKGEGKRASRK